MRLLKICSLLFVWLIVFKPASSQVVDPTDWTYEVKKLKGNNYELIFHLKLKEGWHIWSIKPGGDGFQIVPSFSFNKNAPVTLKGIITEKGEKITRKMEGVEGAVSYYSNKVDYKQRAIITKGVKITGVLEYQVCNEQLCLPPKKKDFVFEIKS